MLLTACEAIGEQLPHRTRHKVLTSPALLVIGTQVAKETMERASEGPRAIARPANPQQVRVFFGNGACAAHSPSLLGQTSRKLKRGPYEVFISLVFVTCDSQAMRGRARQGAGGPSACACSSDVMCAEESV